MAESQSSVSKITTFSTPINPDFNINNNSLNFKFGSNLVNIDVSQGIVNDVDVSIPNNLQTEVSAISDRSYKFSYKFSYDLPSSQTIGIKLKVSSSDIIELSNQTTLTNGLYQIDFSDVLKNDFTLQINQDSPNSATIMIKKTYPQGLNIVSIDPTIVFTGSSALSIGDTGYQKKVWYANGTYWVFWFGSVQIVNYSSSLNGSVWNPPVTLQINVNPSSSWDIDYNSTHFIVAAKKDNGLCSGENINYTQFLPIGEKLQRVKPSNFLGNREIGSRVQVVWLRPDFTFATHDGRWGAAGTCDEAVIQWSMVNDSGFTFNDNNISQSFLETPAPMTPINRTAIFMVYPAANTNQPLIGRIWYDNASKGSPEGSLTAEETIVASGTNGVYKPIILPNGTIYIFYTNTSNNNIEMIIRSPSGIYSPRITVHSNIESDTPTANTTFILNNDTWNVFLLMSNQTGIWIKSYTNSTGNWGNFQQVFSRTGSKSITTSYMVANNSTHYIIPLTWIEGNDIVFGEVATSIIPPPPPFPVSDFSFIWNNNTQSVFLNHSFSSLFLNVSSAKITTLISTLTSQTILPSSDFLYDLGSTTSRWLNIFTQNVNATNSVNATRIYENNNRFPQPTVCAGTNKISTFNSDGSFSCLPDQSSIINNVILFSDNAGQSQNNLPSARTEISTQMMRELVNLTSFTKARISSLTYTETTGNIMDVFIEYSTQTDGFSCNTTIGWTDSGISRINTFGGTKVTSTNSTYNSIPTTMRNMTCMRAVFSGNGVVDPTIFKVGVEFTN